MTTATVSHHRQEGGPLTQDVISTPEMMERIRRIRKERLREQGVVPIEAFRSNIKKAEKTILVIDDEQIMRNVLVRIFEHDGFKVIPVNDALGLEDYLDQEQPSMILLDINLPWVNGYELCRLFKQHEQLRHVPIVFVSGNTNEDHIKKGFDAGCDDYIKKPFCIDELRETVETLLKLNQD